MAGRYPFRQSEEAVNALPGEILQEKLAAAEEQLRLAGAHYVVETVADLLPIIEATNQRVMSGERPD